jgi:signal transduction histidine kinase/CheY-like chemotaxis protein
MNRRRLLGHGVALGSVTGAVGLTFALAPVIRLSVTPLFFAAVVVSSCYGGMGPGLVATVIAAFVTEFYFFPPLYAVDAATVVRLSSFVLVACLVASLYARARRAQVHAEGLARAREELLTHEQAARAEAETASRAKDEFLATLSHELRTPLNALVGWIWWLRTGGLDEARTTRALETIERNTRALAQLIEDLLDVSRIITGKLRLDIRAVELVPIIEAAIDAVRPAANAKGIEIRATLDAVAGPILGDPDRLQQIMWNLLSNAVKFTPEKGRVDVRLLQRASSVEIMVNDTGKGISADLLPYVFDRFRQATASGALTQGLGLGLSIVRHLVEVHGGHIRAESGGEGQGATFTLTLPLAADAPAGAHVAAAPAAMPVAAESAMLDNLRVLVVDDAPEALEWLVHALSGFGAEVVPASSVREALDTLQHLRPDVIVSDIRLPDEDGYDLIRKVRALDLEHGRHTPAVALTAYPRVEDRARALRAGYQMHVPKPVEPSALASVIASVAGRAPEGIA